MSENIDWKIEGTAFGHCNCAWGCPCQFNALPTTGQCEAVWAMRIDEGHFNGTQLDGLVWGGLLWWPGAVHEGNGKQQVFYEERATTEQRQAIDAIASGEVSAEGTWFQIVAAMAPDFQPAIAAAIDFDGDIDARTGHLVVPDIVEVQVNPIRNPITDEELSVNVNLPNGMEYHSAEYASGSAKTHSNAAIALDLSDTHAHFYHAAWNANGVANA